MARPTTKAALLAASDEGLRLLLDEIDSIPVESQVLAFPLDGGDRGIRDVLCHLYEWHQLMIGWYAVGMSGGRPDVPAPGHTWKSTPALNAELRAKHTDTSLEEARTLLVASHAAVQELIRVHTDDELFTKQRYRWTGTTSLGAYLVSSTSSHYDWARKKIRRYRRTLTVRDA